MRAVLAAALVVLIAGCGVPRDDEPRALDPANAPFRVFEQGPSKAPQGEGRVALYFVRNGRVVLQTRAVERSTEIDELLRLLLEGPTVDEVESGTTSSLPTTFTVEDVQVGDDGIAVVTIGSGATQTSTSPLGFAQIVATLTAPGRAESVRFRQEGVDLRVPRGDGSLTSEPVDRDDYAELLALATPPPTAPRPSPVPSPS